MDYRGVMAAAFVLGAGVLSLTASCSAPDPGQITFSERPHQGLESSSGASGGTSGTSGAVPPTGTDAGGDGAASSGGPVDAFTGAATYVKGTANGTSQNNSHTGGVGGGNPAGQNCLDCHKTGGTGPAWVFGGTVYTTKGGNTAAADGVEVRLVSAAGVELASTYTDALGNFWIDQLKDNTTAIPAGAKIGVRDATNKQPMLTALQAGQGGCAATGCHIAGGQGTIGLQ